MKKLLVLVILCCYHATSLYAQQTISLPNADAISFNCDGNNIEVYTKIGPNQYTRQSLQVERQTRQDKPCRHNADRTQDKSTQRHSEQRRHR